MSGPTLSSWNLSGRKRYVFHESICHSQARVSCSAQKLAVLTLQDSGPPSKRPISFRTPLLVTATVNDRDVHSRKTVCRSDNFAASSRFQTAGGILCSRHACRSAPCPAEMISASVKLDQGPKSNSTNRGSILTRSPPAIASAVSRARCNGEEITKGFSPLNRGVMR
jgi:hypothetical protein